MSIVSEIRSLIKTLWQKGFVHLLSANVITLIFGFASQLFIAWILPPEDIGRIRIMQTWLGIFTIVAGLGFNVSVLKLCSENRAPGELVYLYNKAIRYTLLAVIGTYLVMAGISALGVLSPDPVVNKYMFIFGISLLPLTISAVYMSYIQAKQKIKLYSKIQVLTKLFAIMVIILLTWLYKLEGFVIAIVIGYFLTNVFLERLIRKKINAGITQTKTAAPLKLHWKYARYSLGAAITDTLGLGIDILLLNYLVSDRTEIGYYSFAITIIGIYRILPSTIWTMAAPHFSGKMDQAGEWVATYRKYNRLILIASLVITSFSVLLIPFVLKYFLHGKYEQSGIYFILLVVAWGIRNMFVIKASVLFGMGKINYNFYSSLIYLILSIILVPTLILIIGVPGAAVGVVFCNLLAVHSVNHFFKKAVGITQLS
ncbi:MAG: oligosaccharide flippase family protein [Bacteroidales bacterium]|nr:oligosaccharide flippase family protein [Bacteroidales bacterium]